MILQPRNLPGNYYAKTKEAKIFIKQYRAPAAGPAIALGWLTASLTHLGTQHLCVEKAEAVPVLPTSPLHHDTR